MERFKSRKLWAMIVGVALNLFNAAADLGIGEDQLNNINVLIIGYLAAEGITDASRAYGTVPHDEI